MGAQPLAPRPALCCSVFCYWSLARLGPTLGRAAFGICIFQVMATFYILPTKHRRWETLLSILLVKEYWPKKLLSKMKSQRSIIEILSIVIKCSAWPYSKGPPLSLLVCSASVQLRSLAGCTGSSRPAFEPRHSDSSCAFKHVHVSDGAMPSHLGLLNCSCFHLYSFHPFFKVMIHACAVCQLHGSMKE